MTTVREAQPQDAEAAVAVVRASIEALCTADHRNDPETLSQWLANKTPQSFRTWIANPDNFFVVALDGERLIGVGLLRREGEIVLFYLQPGTQRRGIGSALYEALEGKAIDWGLRELHLGSTCMARPFYESRGFRATGPARHRFGLLQSYPYEKRLQSRDIGSDEDSEQREYSSPPCYLPEFERTQPPTTETTPGRNRDKPR
jgi:GNAT superfamily N-acetyltransferase